MRLTQSTAKVWLFHSVKEISVPDMLNERKVILLDT
jgi:hypothetical protein